MQYYFSAKSNTLDYDDNKRYDKILSKLESLGHENTNYVHMDLNSKKYKMIQNYINKNEKTVLDLQLEYLLSSDALICDLTVPSTTVSFQIATAINSKIPCLAIILQDEYNNTDELDPIVLTKEYYGLLKYAKISDLDELDEIVNQFILECVERPYKFNFFLPLNTHNTIARHARKSGKSKSELIREIIDNYIEKNKDKLQ